MKNLLKWNENSNRREMPWKGEKDPYKIWLSEVILQQTRVDQGLSYYNRFIENFPAVVDLANASETFVFKLWEGLGYYTRCKNLIATARHIAFNLDGKFPTEYEEILALKGIGPYTAAAIGSFAFDLPHAVVDGNVFRVLSRYFGIRSPIDSTEGKKYFTALANKLLEKKHPGIYNQALMDFGAIICKPQLPLCATCIMNNDCSAYQAGMEQQLPIKEKAIKKKTRWFYFLVIEADKKVFVRKRAAGDIWENLYEFVTIEPGKQLDLAEDQLPLAEFGLPQDIKTELVHISPYYRQHLTHQTIKGQFIYVKIDEPVKLIGYQMVSKKAFLELPFPKFISNYIKDKNVSLNLLNSDRNQHSAA